MNYKHPVLQLRYRDFFSFPISPPVGAWATPLAVRSISQRAIRSSELPLGSFPLATIPPPPPLSEPEGSRTELHHIPPELLLIPQPNAAAPPPAAAPRGRRRAVLRRPLPLRR
jgi:hypothetical protein